MVAGVSLLSRLIIITEIFGGVWGLADDIDRITFQQRACLGLVVRGDVVGLRQWLAEDATIVLIRIFGANENAYAVLRLGIKVTDIAATKIMNYEAVRRQRMERLFPGGIVGEMYLEAGG